MTTAAAPQPAEARLVSGFFMKIDGAPAQKEVIDDLLSARIEGSVHLPDMALLEFRNPDFELMKRLLAGRVLFDGRNLYDHRQMESLGFTYYAIGRGRAEPK